MNKDKIKQIAEDVEREWVMGGLSDGIYFDYALEITTRYCSQQKIALLAKMKVLLADIVEQEGYQEMADGADQMIDLVDASFNQPPRT